jgi:hypothetical protein
MASSCGLQKKKLRQNFLKVMRNFLLGMGVTLLTFKQFFQLTFPKGLGREVTGRFSASQASGGCLM